MIQVLGLCTYPLEAACTRYRLIQFTRPLLEREIDLTISPLLTKNEFATFYKHEQTLHKALRLFNSARKRLFDSVEAGRFDAILVQREAMLAGPPVFEWLYKTIGKCPLILDLDDATYIRYVSPTFGRLGSALKFFGKTDKLIEWSEIVICGNQTIADYVTAKGKNAVVVPTVVDTDKFCPVKKDAKQTPVIGWIGTHSTFPFLETLFPVFKDLAREVDFTLKIVGAGTGEIKIENVKVENSAWNLESEIADFQSLDIGLYPLGVNETFGREWIAGKSGFKAIQYMAVGIPFVVTPIGTTEEIGIVNETHFCASNPEQWRQSLLKLLKSAELREKMGANGRRYALKHYTVPQQTAVIADVIEKAVANFKKS